MAPIVLALFAQSTPSRIDLDGDRSRQTVVDREAGQYLGHPTTVLLENGRTILAVYPKGHGKGPILLKRSEDGGKTWGPRLPTPKSWETSLETPTIHRVVDPRSGKRRLIVWSGLHPARFSVSEDDGRTWTELAPAGNWGGIVVMSSMERLRNGDYLGMFHDDGRFFTANPQTADIFTVYRTLSRDGGRTWSFPEVVLQGDAMHLCEPGLIRSPDGKTLAALLRENRRKYNSQIIFSTDEGRTWSKPRALPECLTGDRHTAKFAPDGRLLVSFREMATGDWQGDWVAWVGTWEDLEKGRNGQYKVRLKDNRNEWDSSYPGVEVLPDGAFVLTTYGHWDAGLPPYIISVRLSLSELDARADRTARTRARGVVP